MTNYLSKTSRISIESLDTLGQRIIDTVNSSVIAEAKISKYFIQLIEVNNRFRQALTPPDYKELTVDIGAKQNQCEDAYLDIYDYLKGLQKSPDAEISIAATKLFGIVGMYGRKYLHIKAADRISRYSRILTELQKEENSAAVSKTMLTTKLTDFATSFQEHEIAFRERGNIRKANKSASSLRAEMEEAVKLYLEDLQWQTRKTDTEKWRVLCSNVEARFDEMNVSRGQRRTASNNSTVRTSSLTSADTLPA